MIDANLAMGAGIAMLGTLGPAIGVGLVGAKVIESSARQPEMTGKLLANGLLFALFSEAMGLCAILVGFKMAGIF